MNATRDTALLVLDVRNELVDLKGKIAAGWFAKIVRPRRHPQPERHGQERLVRRIR